MFLAGAIAATTLVVGVFAGGVKAGRAYEANTTLKADLKHSNLVRERQVEVIREVPKIVTRVVTREVEVTKEVERVVIASESLLAPDCVLPDNFGLLLVSAANGVDPEAAGSVDAFRGAYGCKQALAAILADLQAGWRNSARLEGLQEWAKLVTKEAPAQ
jgi:hypothetical protein